MTSNEQPFPITNFSLRREGDILFLDPAVTEFSSGYRISDGDRISTQAYLQTLIEYDLPLKHFVLNLEKCLFFHGETVLHTLFEVMRIYVKLTKTREKCLISLVSMSYCNIATLGRVEALIRQQI